MGAILFNDKAYPAGSNQASDSVYDNSATGLPVTTQGAIDKITDNIASANSVELTATAAHAHAVGTYFIWIGQLVKVTSAIAVGDTIADRTNVEATSIADVLTAANGAISHTLRDNVGQQTIRYDNSGSTYSPAKLTLNQNDDFEVTIKADGEGGNLRLRKYNCICELDTWGMSSNGDGAVRFYLNDGTPQTENHKTFFFMQNGSFTDGNGVNTQQLIQRAVTIPTMVMYYQVAGYQSGITFYDIPGAGLVFNTPFGAKYLIFDISVSTSIQIGTGNSSGILPDMETTGANRANFINYNATAGRNVIDISGFYIEPRFYIARMLTTGSNFLISNVAFIHEDY